MLTATVMKRLEALSEISQQGKRINGLFRLLENPILWHEAYANIYANKGVITPGVDNKTLDGFSEERVTSIVARLKNGTYRFQPVRRTYVPKKNGKKRPLGISSGDDKLIQEVVRILLERIYEPIFESSSHGFRPGRSPHTALERIGHEWTAVKWLIDMDLRDYFTTIPHDLLMEMLRKKIVDERFLRLIQAMLDAGYLEDWTFHRTYSGVPQGSIVSPVLANIYLHEFDQVMNRMKEQFDQGKRRKGNKVYQRYTEAIRHLRKQAENLKGKEASKDQLRDIQRTIKVLQAQRRRLPSGDPFDETYKRLWYCRYADDYLIGIIGSYADAEQVSQKVKRYMEETLHLTIAEEKSHLRPSREGTIFLGYEVRTYTGNRVVKVKRGKYHTTSKSVTEQIQLGLPKDRLPKFCESRRYGSYSEMEARHKAELLELSDAEIILAYNSELQGFANYYALALNAKREMSKLERLWRLSLFKTLAAKHKTSMTKTAKRLKTNDGYALTVQIKDTVRHIKIFRLKDLKPCSPKHSQVDLFPNTYIWTLSRTELIKRLNTHQCEYCGTRQGSVEVHHIRKLKDVAEGKALWQQMMAARRRKTLVLCTQCHHLLHKGELPEREYRQQQVRGEPCAVTSRMHGSERGVRATR
jgi:group II intron reverse transcriptase/maturase